MEAGSFTTDITAIRERARQKMTGINRAQVSGEFTEHAESERGPRAGSTCRCPDRGHLAALDGAR
jgi:hypothetical protein